MDQNTHYDDPVTIMINCRDDGERLIKVLDQIIYEIRRYLQEGEKNESKS